MTKDNQTEIKYFPLILVTSKIHEPMPGENISEEDLFVDTVIGETEEMQAFRTVRPDNISDSILNEEINQSLTCEMQRVFGFIEHLILKYNIKTELRNLLENGLEVDYVIILADDNNLYGSFDRDSFFDFLLQNGFNKKAVKDLDILLLAEENFLEKTLYNLDMYIKTKMQYQM